MFGPIWWYFFQQEQDLGQWTVYLPGIAEWDVDVPALGVVVEEQE